MQCRPRALLITVALGVGVLGLAAPAQATSPRQNGRIAYHKYDALIGGDALYTANPDGTHVERVANVPGTYSNWSADGKYLAFAFTDADGYEQIAVTDPEGNNWQQLTRGPSYHDAPAFSPDGTQIVYQGAPIQPATGFHVVLWIMNSDGSNPHPLIPGSLDSQPEFSPDGRFISFIRDRLLPDPPYDQSALFVMNADGTNLRQLTAWDQVVLVGNDIWSPDSRWITYNNHGFDGKPRSIFKIRADGAVNVLLYEAQGFAAEGAAPSFSPDGTKILFSCVTNNHQRSFDVDLCVMNASDGSDVTNITDTGDGAVGKNLERHTSWGTAPLK